MNLNTLRDQVHGLAKSKGWHDDTMSVIDYMAKATANLHGETSELWEAARRGELNKQCDKACALTCIEEELADIIIRALDTAGRMGVDIEAAVSAKHFYNATRPHRHGGKLA